MAQPTGNARDLGPIRRSDGQRICTAVGISTARARVVTLTQLRDGLKLTISELESERRKDAIVAKGYMVARITKATCDAFIDMAATLASLLPATKKGAEKVASLYGAITPVAQAGVATLLGQGKSVDWAGTLAAAGKKGVGVATENEGYRLVAEGSGAKIEILSKALNQDKKGLLKSAASYSYDLHATLAGMAGWEKSSAAAKIMKAAFEYNEKLGEILTEMEEITSESDASYHSLKNDLLAQGRNVSKQIEKLQVYVSSCSADQGI